MKNCLVCNIEITDNKKYCSRECYNIILKKNLELRNKSNIGKSWVDIMGSETAEIRKKNQSERFKKNNPSSNPEVSKKISESIKKYRKLNPLKGDKNPFYGKKHSDEYKIIQSKNKKGKRSYDVNQYVKQKINTLKGEKHPNWNGGTSNHPYPFEFNKQLKENVKNRDLHKCGVCNKQTQKLAIHHIDYNKNNIKFENLISLCYSCHSKTNFNRECWVEFFDKKINK
jgi:hypothetical protein